MEEEKENQGTKTDNDSIVKITITREAAETLAQLVARANEGFDGGRINRQNLASYIIEKYKTNFSERELAHIRQLHYDDSAMFDAVYKRAKETGEIPEYLREALKRHFQGQDDAPKKVKKALTREYINDVPGGHEEQV